MNSYILIIIADMLLAMALAFQKKYQSKAGTSLKASLRYNVFTGVFSAIMFFAINGFTVRATWFSIACALAFTISLITYLLTGFRLMERGNMSLYTLFLMSGGMTVPYIYGLAFLGEQPSVMRTIGLLLLIGAIFLVNFSKNKIDKKQIFLCIVVFVFNGLVSVISKVHQISSASAVVSSSDFVFLVNVCKVLISLLALCFIRGNGKVSETVSVPIKSVVLIILFAAFADGLSYMLQLVGAVNIPATVLYPLVSGGVIILSTLVDFVCFKEKISPKQWAAVGVSFLGTLMFL